MCRRRVACLAATTSAWLIVPPTAGAQTLPAGEGSVSINHSFAYSSVHLGRDGTPNPNLGRENIHVVFVDVQYGLTDRISVGAVAAWVATQWIGDERDRHGPIDTGAFHQGLQDARAEVRYGLQAGRVQITPFVGAGGPTHDYETAGHSAFGRGLHDVQVGLDLGTPIGRVGYLEGSVAYAFVGRVRDVDLDLDRLTGQVVYGHPIGSRLWASGACTWQYMPDGLEVGPQTDHLELKPVHDRLARSSFAMLGGGLAIGLNQRFDLTVSGLSTIVGRGVHRFHSITTGLTWRFGGGLKLVTP